MGTLFQCFFCVFVFSKNGAKCIDSTVFANTAKYRNATSGMKRTQSSLTIGRLPNFVVVKFIVWDPGTFSKVWTKDWLAQKVNNNSISSLIRFSR